MDELAYDSNSLATIFDVQCMLCGNVLTYGSAYIKDKYLRPFRYGYTGTLVFKNSVSKSNGFNAVGWTTYNWE